MRRKLRLHYARLYAANVVDLQSKFTSALCSGRLRRAFGRALARHSRLSFVFGVLRNALHAAILGNIIAALIMQPCRNPRGTNFVCAARDHLLAALSIPAVLRLNGPRTISRKQAALRWIFQRCRAAFGGELPLLCIRSLTQGRYEQVRDLI